MEKKRNWERKLKIGSFTGKRHLKTLLGWVGSGVIAQCRVLSMVCLHTGWKGSMRYVEQVSGS